MDHPTQEVDDCCSTCSAMTNFLEAAKQIPRQKLVAEARAVRQERIAQSPKRAPVRMFPLTRAELDEMARETDRRISRRKEAA